MEIIKISLICGILSSLLSCLCFNFFRWLDNKKKTKKEIFNLDFISEEMNKEFIQDVNSVLDQLSK